MEEIWYDHLGIHRIASVTRERDGNQMDALSAMDHFEASENRLGEVNFELSGAGKLRTQITSFQKVVIEKRQSICIILFQSILFSPHHHLLNTPASS